MRSVDLILCSPQNTKMRQRFLYFEKGEMTERSIRSADSVSAVHFDVSNKMFFKYLVIFV